ncbi:hypothetical protein GXB81_02620 [Paraburkholderia sp. Ac-20336]|uniref:hypothetical protein n=1 Tax=Paraburkholderia sp. Ac-20336 TaxID=2703886 RepID=UPI00198050D5|nr:hypothetical protein [Paraburkholderia sp. Ac-20336]MBN3801952.1 hypothetical protein [Paraburkholderia sp. Ac-20336]
MKTIARFVGLLTMLSLWSSHSLAQVTEPPSPAPEKPRCESYWLGAVAADASYAFLSDYTRVTPVTQGDRDTLILWQRGQRLVRCGTRLSNKTTGQSIAISE